MFFFTPKEVRRFNKEMENSFGVTRKSRSVTFACEARMNLFFEYIADFVASHPEKPLKFFNKAAVVPYLLKQIWSVALDGRDDNIIVKDFFTPEMYSKIGCRKMIDSRVEIFFKRVATKIQKQNKV